MALISGFEHDIFISYAHVDNIPFQGQTIGWVDCFYSSLKLMLDKRLGRMDLIKIWRDGDEIDGSTYFDGAIEQSIKKSAIMVCINSPGYCSSRYCQKELDIFYNKVKNEKPGLKVGDRSRIIHVLLNKIPFREWPPQLGGTTGFHFYDGADDGTWGDPVETDSTAFRTQMQTIRNSIYYLLIDFQKEQGIKIVNEEIKLDKAQDGFSIYIGEVADTLRTPRKRIITELEKKGFTVVAGIPPPDEGTAHEQATKTALQKSDLAIHLLDEYPGREIIGTPEICYPQKQAEIALGTDRSQMIWVPAEIDFSAIEDENYKNFLAGIENRKATSKGYEFIRGAKGTLAKEVIDFAEQLKEEQLQKKPGNEKLYVLLDTHLKDQLYAMELGKVLIENNIQPFINPQEDDPRKNINLLEDRIKQVTKLIFLYGSVSKEWLLERVSAALQFIITRNYPVDSFYIFMAPPQKAQGDISIKQKFLKINIIDSSKNSVLDKAVLEQLLIDLKSDTA